MSKPLNMRVLVSKFYPVDPFMLIIQDDPYDTETELQKHYPTSYTAVKGKRLIDYPAYQLFTVINVAPPADEAQS